MCIYLFVILIPGTYVRYDAAVCDFCYLQVHFWYMCSVLYVLILPWLACILTYPETLDSCDQTMISCKEAADTFFVSKTSGPVVFVAESQT